MGGYFFVLIEYANGRYAYTAARYKTEHSANVRKTALERRANVKKCTVCYQSSFSDVDIKKFII